MSFLIFNTTLNIIIKKYRALPIIHFDKYYNIIKCHSNTLDNLRYLLSLLFLSSRNFRCRLFLFICSRPFKVPLIHQSWPSMAFQCYVLQSRVEPYTFQIMENVPYICRSSLMCAPTICVPTICVEDSTSDITPRIDFLAVYHEAVIKCCCLGVNNLHQANPLAVAWPDQLSYQQQ